MSPRKKSVLSSCIIFPMAVFFQLSVGVIALALLNMKTCQVINDKTQIFMSARSLSQHHSSHPWSRWACRQCDTTLRHNRPSCNTSLQLGHLQQCWRSSRRHRKNTLGCCCRRRNCRLQSSWEIHNFSWGRCTCTAKWNYIHVRLTIKVCKLTRDKMA